MKPQAILSHFGKQNDQCMCALLSYFYEKKGQWTNKAEVTLMRFVYPTRKGRRYFSSETVGRKCRLLAELNLISRKEESGQTFYTWPRDGNKIKRYEFVPVIVDGVRMVRKTEITETI